LYQEMVWKNAGLSYYNIILYHWLAGPWRRLCYCMEFSMARRQFCEMGHNRRLYAVLWLFTW